MYFRLSNSGLFQFESPPNSTSLYTCSPVNFLTYKIGVNITLKQLKFSITECTTGRFHTYFKCSWLHTTGEVTESSRVIICSGDEGLKIQLV